MGEGASSRTPGLLYSCTHQHHTSGLEGDCSCSTVPEVGKSNCKCLALLCCVLASAQVLCPTDTHPSLFSMVLVCSNRHRLQRQHCFSSSHVPSTLIRCIRALTSLGAYPGTRLTRVAFLIGHMLIKAVGDVDQEVVNMSCLKPLHL